MVFCLRLGGFRQAVAVDIVRVDPRDQGWEDSRPGYRVYFHDAHGASDEYEVSDVDVRSVLDWAEPERGDRTYVLYACARSDGLGLLRLQGHNPNGC